MLIYPNGKRPDGTFIVPPMDQEQFARVVLGGLDQNGDRLQRLAGATVRAAAYGVEAARRTSKNLYDPREAGWTVVLDDTAPDAAAMLEALAPLAHHRGVEGPLQPLHFSGLPQEAWNSWVDEHFSSDDVDNRPEFVLILGGPDRIPFEFQSLLDTTASVGRVAFDTPEELASYVEKVIRIETGAQPVASRTAVFFAPDADEATQSSLAYLAQPLAAEAKQQHAFDVTPLFGPDATKALLTGTVGAMKPALVYTASHGLGATTWSLADQKQWNGAILCQTAGDVTIDDFCRADDLAADSSFAEGGVFFQFACFGYGTPATSSFDHWQQPEAPTVTAGEPFIAALPRRLLAMPAGPIAYFGHADLAWSWAFAFDPGLPAGIGPYQHRLKPFESGLSTILEGYPMGMVLKALNERYSRSNNALADTWDRVKAKSIAVDEGFLSRLATLFVARNDEQHYHLFGDPGTHLRVPADEN